MDDAELLQRLRERDSGAFAVILDAWSPGMVRLAGTFVSTDASAEEVLQDTWLAVMTGVGSFEGRSSLRTWVYRILVNTAKRCAERESRTVPWSSWADDPADNHGPTVDPDRFQSAEEQFPGHWRDWPRPWPPFPERQAMATELRAVLNGAVDGLPARQRIVVLLRDVEGYASHEVCAILDITVANQRVLLHRGRAAVRANLERYFGTTDGPAPAGGG
ncbi:RNA polymerase sigma factor [Nakamurella sp. GG22]